MFELKQSGEQFHFVLKAKNGRVILSSEMYNSKRSAKKGIDSVKVNSIPERFDRRTSEGETPQPYFVLLAKNKKVIGTSEMYNYNDSRENGIQSVIENAPKAEVKEIKEAIHIVTCF